LTTYGLTPYNSLVFFKKPKRVKTKNKMTKQLDTLFQREMTRKEFLATLGFGMASIMGFSTVIQLLTGKSINGHLGRHVSSGYGSSPYGGGRD
jgi:hypothetical protein